ncbi:MAG TPA: class I SAM-dependent methyltransferase [Phycisphaerae bacterium]|nr:class I SAM-dependent methyltransferase [Phycisphaerae bacterium]
MSALPTGSAAASSRREVRDRCNICGRRFDAQTCERVRVRCNVRKFAGEYFHLWRCAGCRCLHGWEVIELGPYYAGYGTKDQRLDFFSRLAYGRQLARLRAAGLQRNHRILDYGCGSGNLVLYLRSRGYSGAEGYDPYGDSAGWGNAAVLRADSFDCVCLQDVIEHVEDAGSLLKKLAGLLTSQGILLVGTPSADEIDLGKTHRHLHQLHVPYHLHLYTRAALVQLGAATGLTAERSYRRYYMETPFFGMNEAFCRAYLERLDDNIDSLVEPPRIGRILRSPTLIFHGTFGYLYSPRHSVTIVFRKGAA